jgi:hypothetical protein
VLLRIRNAGETRPAGRSWRRGGRLRPNRRAEVFHDARPRTSSSTIALARITSSALKSSRTRCPTAIRCSPAGAHTINPAVYKKLPYDTLRDFTPIAYMANSTGLVDRRASFIPAKTLKELIAIARSSPERSCTARRLRNLTHIAGELFQVMTGVKLNHVPYKSVGPR